MRKFSFLAIAMLVMAASAARAQTLDMVLSEWNATADNVFLGNQSDDDPYFDSTFVEIDGYSKDEANAGNWVELYVRNTSDIRGWVLTWANDDGGGDGGTVTFRASGGSSSQWSSVPAGTVITLIEDASDIGENFDQYEYGDNACFGTGIAASANHWNVPIDFDAYVSHDGGFKVDNDNWRMKIEKGDATSVQGWIGESITGWGGSGGVGNDEVGALTIHPSSNGIDNGDYDDRKNSSFGVVND